jgi:hypothetical protein
VILVDSNLLIYARVADLPQHEAARACAGRTHW